MRSHPIDSLIETASTQHDAWLKQASASKTINDCTGEYRRRYKRHPPPGFDAWYHYAVDKSSIVIDDFDNLMEDLELFWAIEPAEIRRRTREALSDPWNEVAELKIRSGKAEIGPDVKPTHRWMLDGVVSMMSNFVDKLPDMDLGFNINDEPRIAIPYFDLQSLLKTSVPTDAPSPKPLNSFSPNRTAGWNFTDPNNPDDPLPPTRPFTDASFTPTFHTYGSISCPPSSPARRTHTWDTSTLCPTCSSPHSSSLFLSNWSLSASPCHQPDLAHLHGFYLSPSAFKPSHALYPIFSQSKAQGFADIRYPSPWNYIDKAVYRPSAEYPDPAFKEKRDSMFWRGATSEGMSRDGEWMGMARQRLVHWANNNTDAVPILLPSSPSSVGGNNDGYSIQHIPPSALPALGLNITDIAFVAPIQRCWDTDCSLQSSHFHPLISGSDFQSHWTHKYLIDADGAGFSGRFIPFLQSRSLVFKVAGVFREWWDGRVEGWRHFVPVDVRLTGLWSTVAFFRGGGGEEKGERIATEGREWVGRVMRKEDMEVYFFRLLLEWGRLTDDGREELGFGG
ncbi:MAG: hypothetical protein Q9220_006782 [cf. Caloplaca sp. 1 TL-2023]